MTFSRFFFTFIAATLMADLRAQSVPLDAAGYTDFVAAAARRESGDTVVTVKGPLRVAVGDLDVRLDRAFAHCSDKPAECAAEVDQFAKAIGQVLKQKNAPLDPATVQLVLRSDDYIKRAQASFGTDGPTLQVRPLVPGLLVVAVLDTPRAIRPLDERDLKKLNLQQDQLFALGGVNLLASLKPLSVVAPAVVAGQIGTIKPGFGEVGRVALPLEWTALAQAQHGELVIAVPTTDQILYISESTPAAIDALRALSRRLGSRSQNPLAPETLLRWSDGQWKVAR